MAHQALQCSATILRCFTTTPHVQPGAVLLCAEPVVVELPVVEYATPTYHVVPQDLILSNPYILLSDLRGPPQTTSSIACRGARSCAPQIVSSSPRGVYAH